MFDDVPEPVWKTSIGNWSSSSPLATRSAAAAIRCAASSSSRPSSPLTRAAAALIRPSQRATDTGIGSPETGKFSTAFRVSAPQSSCFVAVSATFRTLARAHPPAGLEQPLPRGQLHARAAERLAGGAFSGVDRLPALVLDVVDAALVEQLLQRRRSRAGDTTRAHVLEQRLDRLGRVLLVRADDAARASFDPAGAVGPLGADHAALDVRDHAPLLVERQAEQRQPLVADAPQD